MTAFFLLCRPTRFTKAEELEFMIVHNKAPGFCNFLLQALDPVVVKFNDFPALAADKMIVVSLLMDKFEPCILYAEMMHRGNAAVDQELEGTVHG